MTGVTPETPKDKTAALLKLLSPEDYDRYMFDLQFYGQAWLRSTKDGGARYVPRDEYLRALESLSSADLRTKGTAK